MSNQMTFKGSYSFQTPQQLNSAMKELHQEGHYAECGFTEQQLLVKETQVIVSIETAGDEEAWDDYSFALKILSEDAKSGAIDCVYHGPQGTDSTPRIRIHAGGDEEEF